MPDITNQISLCRESAVKLVSEMDKLDKMIAEKGGDAFLLNSYILEVMIFVKAIDDGWIKTAVSQSKEGD